MVGITGSAYMLTQTRLSYCPTGKKLSFYLLKLITGLLTENALQLHRPIFGEQEVVTRIIAISVKEQVISSWNTCNIDFLS